MPGNESEGAICLGWKSSKNDLTCVNSRCRLDCCFKTGSTVVANTTSLRVDHVPGQSKMEGGMPARKEP